MAHQVQPQSPERGMFTYHLATTCAASGYKLPDQLDPPSFWVHRARPYKIIDGKLDRLLGRDTL